MRSRETVDLSQLEITTCLRRAALEVDIRHRPGAEEACERLVEGIVGPARAVRVQHRRLVDRRPGRRTPGRPPDRARRVVHGRLLAARLTEIPGSSEYVAGGVVAYSNQAKPELLDVPAELIERHGAVSPEVAEAMAQGALARFHGDLGVGITGSPGRTGGTEAKPIGYVCICVKSRDGAEIARDPVLPGNRAEIRDRSTTLAMHLMRRLLRGEDFPI